MRGFSLTSNATGHRLVRSLDDRHALTALVMFPDRAAAEGFVADASLRQAMASAGAPVEIRAKEFKREFPGGNPYANQATRNVVRLADVTTDAVNARLREHDLHLAAAQALAVLEGAGEPWPPTRSMPTCTSRVAA